MEATPIVLLYNSYGTTMQQLNTMVQIIKVCVLILQAQHVFMLYPTFRMQTFKLAINCLQFPKHLIERRSVSFLFAMVAKQFIQFKTFQIFLLSNLLTTNAAINNLVGKKGTKFNKVQQYKHSKTPRIQNIDKPLNSYE